MYAARSEDNYAMCNDPTNQFLTDMASAHIIFQPLFISMLLMSMYRRHDITARIEADLIWKLSAFMGLWYVSYPWGCALMGVPQDFATRATGTYAAYCTIVGCGVMAALSGSQELLLLMNA